MTTPNTDAAPVSCSLCGRADEGLDSWLMICCECLAQAARAGVESERPPPPLARIAGYETRRLIGRGGMGSVYEAVRESDGLRVALKLIVPEMAAEPRFRNHFLRETEALRTLDHPGVIRRLDSGEEGGLPWLVMEFIDGPDLRQVLRRGPLPVARALEIAVEAGEAVAAAHAAGIVHRDIKPANLLLDPTGRVKVADFGMARPHGSGETVSDPLTLAGAVGQYSAPELEHKGGGDARADIYSMGALLYHLLVGHAPRPNYRPARRERPGEGISAGMDRIIFRCLQSAPERRFETMADLLASLERERSRLARKPGRSRWIRAGIIALVAALCVILMPRYKESAPPLVRPGALIAPAIRGLPEAWVPATMTNTLGMPFVSVPGSEVMFCVWETRVRDYAAFAAPWPDPEDAWVRETGFAFPLKKAVFSLRRGEFRAAGKSWQDPGFAINPDDAVSGVSASDAMAFCTWLTWKERGEGKIRPDQTYRLPTDEEWSLAAGLTPERGGTPEERFASLPADWFLHPWGRSWPAPDGIYNVVGDEVDDWEDWNQGWIHRPRRDPWRGSAPVDAVPPDPRGLYHLTGNVWEWTETPYNQSNEAHTLVLRGGSWMDASRESLSLAFRDRDLGTQRMTKRGFRVVFQRSGAAGWRYGEAR